MTYDIPEAIADGYLEREHRILHGSELGEFEYFRAVAPDLPERIVEP